MRRPAQHLRGLCAPRDAVATPAGWVLDPAVAHCNHGAFGAVTHATLVAVEAARRRVEANPAGFFAREYADVYQRGVAAAEAFVRAPAGSLALVGNATEAIDVALRLAGLEASDVVVTTAETYPAVTANVARRCAAVGARHLVADWVLGASDDEVEAAIEAAARAATVAVIDHVASPTGRLLPVERLVARLRAQGVLTIVDGAHALGQVPVDLGALRPDVWFGNTHKWACGPKSLALLYIDEAHHARVPPVLTSADSDGAFPRNAAWTGTRDPGPLLVLPSILAAATSWLRPAERRGVSGIVAGWQQAVAAALDVAPPTFPAAWMRCVPLPAIAASRAHRAALAAAMARDLRTEAAVTAVRDQTLLRLSAHVYSQPDDLTRVVASLPRLLRATGPWRDEP